MIFRLNDFPFSVIVGRIPFELEEKVTYCCLCLHFVAIQSLGQAKPGKDRPGSLLLQRQIQ